MEEANQPAGEEKNTAPQAAVPKASSSDVENNKVMAALGYVLFLIPMLAAKDSPFAKYHAKQGLVLFIAGLISSVVAMLPVVGWILSPILWILCTILFIVGIINAVGGKMQPLPGIGQYGEKFKF